MLPTLPDIYWKYLAHFSRDPMMLSIAIVSMPSYKPTLKGAREAVSVSTNVFGWEWSILTISGAVWNTQLEHMYNFRRKANKDADIKEGGLLEH